MARIGLILGDQLNRDHALLNQLDPARDVLVMGELLEEADYVPHHVKKLVLVFSAMRHHARWLKASGWSVEYHSFDPNSQIRGFTQLLEHALTTHGATEVSVAHPGEWRVLEQLQSWSRANSVSLTVVSDRRFISDQTVFNQWADGRKQLRMEYFYRLMRQTTGYLMDAGKPVGGAWNFDADNRRPYKGEPAIPPIAAFEPDAITQDVIELVKGYGQGFGLLEGFDYPVTAEEAEQALDDFIQHRLAYFGDFQDALDDEHDHLFHSRLSSSLNLGLLSPTQVCERALEAWDAGVVPINAVEGFIRQIIGWREFIRGIYWRFMPEYATRNTLHHDQPLPEWYWTGETQMRCLSKAIGATRRNAYAHHIQRLMVTGNFALILGVIPEAICRWYLAVYADAYDWVELPNTLGMVMHADGAVVGSKPYAASGKYVQRMGNHCQACPYRVQETLGEEACPFNALYWDFLIRHRASFESHPRMRMMYRHVDGMDQAKHDAIVDRATWIKAHVNEL